MPHEHNLVNEGTKAKTISVRLWHTLYAFLIIFPLQRSKAGIYCQISKDHQHFIHLFTYRDQQKMKGCLKNGYKSNLSILFWLVFGVWVPHYEMPIQESQDMGNVEHEDIFCLYQNISSLCARVLQWETARTMQQMESVVLNTPVFAGSISFFIRDRNVIFASMLTSYILLTSEWDLHNERSPHTTVCICSPVCFSGSKKHNWSVWPVIWWPALLRESVDKSDGETPGVLIWWKHHLQRSVQTSSCNLML